MTEQALRPINHGFEAEHRMGLEAGRAGLPCVLPADEHGWALFPSDGPQAAAWSRGYTVGIVDYKRQQREAREAAQKAMRVEQHPHQQAS